MLKKIRKHSRKILFIEGMVFLFVVAMVTIGRAPAQAKEAKVISNKGSVIELSWMTSEDNPRFKVYRADSSGKAKFLGGTSSTHYSDKTADSDKAYTYTIVAYDGLKTSKKTVIRYSPSDETTYYRPDVVCYTKEEAAECLRKAMILRAENITLDTAFPDPDASEIYALAIQHTGNPKEGDYLKFQHGGCVAGLEQNGDITTIRYVQDYYSTAEQEAEVDKKAAEIIASLDLDGRTDYEKIKAIYDYLRNNINYDTESYEDDNIKRTAYAGLVKGECVCQGYALSAYRLFLEAGLDSRIIYGTGINEVGMSGPHTWNIVKCNDRYYYLDITWDDLLQTFSFNLQPKGDFEKTHVGKDEYAEDEFYREYEISETGYNANAASVGKCTLKFLSLLKQCKGN